MGGQHRRRNRCVAGDSRHGRASHRGRERVRGRDGADVRDGACECQTDSACPLDLARGQVAGSGAEIFRPRLCRRSDTRLNRQIHVRPFYHRTTLPASRPVHGRFSEELPVMARRSPLPRGGRREEGFILFLAIFVLLIVTVAGLATMLATSMDLTLSGNETKISKIFYAADSGIGYCAARLRTDVNYIGGTMPVGVSSNYPGSGSGDIQVSLTRPLVIGQQTQF